jgi:hypothetical protein
MAQHDYIIANQGFPATRTDINGGFSAIVSNNSGATAPSTTYAYQFWYDTTNNILKFRNADNDAWINFATFNMTADTVDFGASGTLVKIKTITISDDTSVSFVNGSNDVVLDSTYKAYKVIGSGISIADQDNVELRFNASTDTGSNYNVSKRVQGIKNNRGASDNNYSNTEFGASGVTTGSPLMLNLDGNEALNQANFEMTIFNPSSTSTYKLLRSHGSYRRTGGYVEMSDVIMMMETTSAVDAIKFELSASNMDSGTITLYGVTT